MPAITVSDEIYRRLAERAAAQGTTVEKLAAPILERLAEKGATNGRSVPTSEPQSEGDWQQKLAALDALVLSQGDRYPPGFQADVSREAMYEGCGE